MRPLPKRNSSPLVRASTSWPATLNYARAWPALAGERADAVAVPLTDIASNVYDGVVTTVTANVALGFQVLVIFAGPTEERELLVAAVRAAVPASFALRRAEDFAAVSALCERGRVDLVTAAPEDLAALRAFAPLTSAPADADVLTATYSEIGGEPLASAPVRPGETVRYRWNLYRGWLRLSPVDDSPTIFAAAWRRVGDAP